ncbi:ankyrin repeat-containing domain protein [Xylariaceae sp. FL0662B]|nr:ankyrin repeat-containing domain protein [Xylariaceae sp. FL0662B]
MDPLSILAGVTGVVAFTLKASQELITMISDMRDAPVDIVALRVDLENLSMILHASQEILPKQSFNPRDAVLFQTIEQCASSCKLATEGLRDMLNALGGSAVGTKARLLTTYRWMLMKGNIKSQRSKLCEAKASLNLSVSLLNGHLAGKGVEEIQKVIDSLLYGHLIKEFATREDADRFRRKLDDDLRTVTAGSRPSSVADRTDVGYPMDIFMNRLDEAEDLGEDSKYGTGDLQGNTVVPDRGNLYDTVSAGDLKGILQLISAGASMSERFPGGLTVLHHCAIYEERDIAQIALDHGANINAKDTRDRLTPFQLAMREQSWSVADLLVSRGCALTNFDGNMLFAFLRERSNDLPSIKNLAIGLASRMRDSLTGCDIVNQAVDTNDFQVLQLLLEEGFDPNMPEPETNILPVHRATILRRLVCLRFLVKHGANVNGYLPPTVQPFLQDSECHQELKGRLHSRGYTPLSLATNYNDDVDVSMTKLLLENGADPNFVYEPTKSILLLSNCAPYYFEHAKAMIQAGADINYLRSTDNSSALYWAVFCGNTNLVKLLLESGVDPNSTGPSWPLHCAITRGCVEIAIMLIERGADLGVKDVDGQTPLESAKRKRVRRVENAIQKKAS